MDEMKLLIKRFNPELDQKPWLQEFTVPIRESMTVLDAIVHVRDYVDHSVGVRYSCRMASCGSCGMKINGKPRLACYTRVEELRSNTVKVEPMDNFPIIKDLAVDLSGFFAKHKEIIPHLVRSDTQEVDKPSLEYKMSTEELEEILQFTYCIKCGLCTSSCPTFATDDLYIGPQALAQAFRYSMDVRDEGAGERYSILDSEHGVFRCHYAGSCSAVCPKGVDPALGIQLLKRHVMSGRPPRRRGEGAKLYPSPHPELLKPQ